MALSGSYDTSFTSNGHILRIQWSATQNNSGNYSTITTQVRLYKATSWQTSTTKYGTLTVNGNSTYFSFLCNGSGWSTIFTQTHNLSHDSTGKLHLTISCSADIKMKLSGTYYNTVSVSGQWDVDSFSRGTYATGWVINPNNPKSWTSINIFWATAANPDQLWLHVNGGGRIATGQPTSTTQTNGVITASGLSPNTSYKLQLEIVKNGVVSWSPVITESTLTPASSISVSSSSWNPDNILSGTITNPNKAYMRLHLYISCVGSDGNASNSLVVAKDLGAVTSFSWTLSDDQKNAVYTKLKYANKGTVTLYGMSYVPSSYDTWISNIHTTFTVQIDTTKYKPTLSAITAELDTLTSSIMSNTTSLIQNTSSVKISIPKTNITTYKNADIKSVILQYGDSSLTWAATATYTKTLSNFSTTGTYVVSAYVIDTRGNKSATVSKTYTIYNYKSPIITPHVVRELSSGGLTDISFEGMYSSLNNCNGITYIKYGYAIFGTNPSANTSITTYTVSNSSNGIDKDVVFNKVGMLTLDETKNYRFIFEIKDKLKSYSVAVDLVDGNPIVRVLETGQVGVNCKPDTSNLDEKLRVNGNATVRGDLTTQGDIISGNLNITKLVQQIMDTYFDREHPVGSILMSTNSANPSTYLGKGTWVAWGSGRVPTGVNTSDSKFSTVEKTGGASTANLAHNHVVDSHSHVGVRGYDTNYNYYTNYYGNTIIYPSTTGDLSQGYYASPNNAGRTSPVRMSLTSPEAPGTNSKLSSAQSLLQPYITCYMWKRTA